uniref:RRM domain-containing protein n=1 Tax=Glycine max TaxID=3847 RepID=K7LB14_SOYBN
MTTRIAPGVGANLLGQHAAERNQDATAYVGNLDPQISEELLWELFVQAGPVVNVYVPKDRVTNQHQGYGFVEFRSEEDADYAIKVLNMIKLYGKPIRVNKASQDKKSLDVGANLFIGNLDPDVDDNLNQIQDLYMSVTKLYTKSSTTSTVELPPPISASEALIVNTLCALGLAFAFWIANTVYSIELVTHPSLTLFFIWITELPIVTLLYSRYRQNRKQCTYLRAVGRGVLGVPVGALLNFLGAIAVGAPVTFQYVKLVVCRVVFFLRTLHMELVVDEIKD